jgi:hypothetical protein
MFEYIFFDTALRDRFMAYAESRGVSCTMRDDNMGMVVAVPENLAEKTAKALERYYDELEDEQTELIVEEDGGLRQWAGFRYQLPDGQPRLASLQPEIANRLLAAFSMQEIQAMFETVAHSALHPGEEHLHKIMNAGRNKPHAQAKAGH